MAWEKKHGDITLFANDRKTKDTQPDWRGTIHVQGKDYDIALWNKVSKNGNTFLNDPADIALGDIHIASDSKNTILAKTMEFISIYRG